MANRSRALVVSQVGVESAPGTTVAANLLLPNSKLLLMPTGDPQGVHVASGHLYPRDMSNALEWGGGTYEMKAAYDEFYVMADSLFLFSTPGAFDAGTGGVPARNRTWTPSVNAVDTFKTYSAECGQTGAVEKFAYMVFNSAKLTIGKQESPMWTGDLLAQAALPALTLTSTPTVLTSSPIAATSWNLFNPATFGAASTPLTDTWKVEFNYGPRFSFAAYVSSSATSWDALGVGEPIPTSVNVTLPMDVSGSDYAGLFNLAKKRAGTPILLTAQSIGAQLNTVSGGTFRTFRMSMCLKIVGLPTRTEIGPFVGNTWPCQLFVDPVSNKALEFFTTSAS